MDKATSKSEVLLGAFRKRCEAASIYCHYHICNSSDCKTKIKTPLTQYQILQILSLTLLNKKPLDRLFEDALLQYVKEPEHNQLKMFKLYYDANGTI